MKNNNERNKMATGTCLEDTYNYLSDKKDKDNWVIIHALVYHPETKTHPHAVVYNKTEELIYEVSNNFKDKPVKMPFMLWVALGNCSNIKQYTFTEYSKLLTKHKKWDFFHLL